MRLKTPAGHKYCFSLSASELNIHFCFSSSSIWTQGNTADDHDDDYPPINVARDFFSFFNLIGCPLLLTCMCLERYLAVVKPVFYLRIRKIKNYLSVSAVVWLFTWFYALASGKSTSIHLIGSYPQWNVTDLVWSGQHTSRKLSGLSLQED